MKVLHVYKNYYPTLGGIEGHLRALAEALARRPGWTVTALVVGNERRTVREQIGGVAVIRAARLAEVASTPLSLALFTEFRRQRPALVHLHYPYPPGDLACLLFDRGWPLVVTYHSDIVRQRALGALLRPLARRLLARADAIIATSRQYAATSPLLDPDDPRCVIVPFGVDVARFCAPHPLAPALRARYGGPLTLFVGRLRYYKGLRDLVEAAAMLPGRVLIVGDGPEAPALRRQIAAAGLTDRVLLIDAVPDAELPAYYQAADVFALPASERSEAFGIVQLEAMAAGRPVVSTALGTGTTFVNRAGETGLVVRPGDPAALARALRALLADAELRRRLGEAARARVVAEFDAERMVERVIAVYERVLTRRGGGGT